jgi:hypothetical protein
MWQNTSIAYAGPNYGIGFYYGPTCGTQDGSYMFTVEVSRYFLFKDLKAQWKFFKNLNKKKKKFSPRNEGVFLYGVSL